MARQRSSKAGGRNRTLLPDYAVTEWEGLNTFIKDLRQLSDGQSPASLNWLTGRYKDHIELRRGSALLGTNRNLGVGRVSGLAVATKNDNTQVPFFSYAQKLNYYDSPSNTTIEIGSNLFPNGANGEDMSILPYKNIAGAFAYVTSPDSSMYKVVVANPATALDLGPTDYKGNAAISSNRMFLWQRKDTQGQKYTNALYTSVPDRTSLSAYTQTTKQNVATGDGVTKVFTGILPSIPAQSTVFNTEFGGPITAGTAVTAISNGTTTPYTSAGSNLATNDAAYIDGAGGMTQINDLLIPVSTGGSGGGILNINSTAFGAYTSGGTIYKLEYFIDDQNGNLVSNLGGTGTINYATGAYVLNFNTAPVAGKVVYAQYYSEPSLGGITDFVSNGAAAYQQFDGGGDIQTVLPFDQVEYAFHLLTSWYLNINADTPTNLPYRNRVGTNGIRGGFSSEDGIVYLDNSVPSQPRVQILTIEDNSATAVVTIVPTPLSDQLDLTSFGFSKVAIFRWNEYDIMACAPSLNGVIQNQNNALYVRNIHSKQWDYCDIPASCFDEFNGTLVAGDSFSNNIFTLFSGLDDDGANINNYWQGKVFNLGTDGLKKFNRFVIKGLIQQTQSIQVSFAFDSGNFVQLATVSGTGPYVNVGNPVLVGANTIGSHVVGGGGDVLTAYPYEVEFLIPCDLFEYVQPQFVAPSIGYVSIESFIFKDIRLKSRRVPPSRTNDPD